MSDEGDGLKSYVAILLSILVGKNPVRLIDEPETSLHPPQRYAIGQFIGKHGTSAQHATFLATHSSSVLRGILESARGHTSILRLDRAKGPFRGTLLDNQLLLQTIKKPDVRAEAVLDGLFAKAAIVVEAGGDRDVYSTASEHLDDFHRDIQFIPVHGTGGIADVTGFFTRLRINVAVIGDLDLGLDTPKLEAILRSMNKAEVAARVAQLSRELVRLVASIPPAITPQAAREEAESIARSINSWDEEGHQHAVGRLNALSNKIKAVSRLKKGGVDAYAAHPDIHGRLTSIIETCNAVGLFLVPVGELEYWLDLDRSRDRKADWAIAAVSKIRSSGDVGAKLRTFLEAIQRYLATPRIN